MVWERRHPKLPIVGLPGSARRRATATGMAAGIGVAPFAELAHARLQHLVDVKARILTEQPLREGCDQHARRVPSVCRRRRCRGQAGSPCAGSVVEREDASARRRSLGLVSDGRAPQPAPSPLARRGCPRAQTPMWAYPSAYPSSLVQRKSTREGTSRDDCRKWSLVVMNCPTAAAMVRLARLLPNG